MRLGCLLLTATVLWCLSPSGVLVAMGLSEAEARSTIRFSLGWTTTAEEVAAALRAVPPLVERVRREIRG